MNCKIIFYTAHKTAFCERALKKSFSELDLTQKGTAFATDSIMLGNMLIEAFGICDAVFVIGGLKTDDSAGIKNIFSKAMANTKLDEYKKLKNNLGDDGYVFRSYKQLLIVLPDEPQQIEIIMQGPLCGYIKKTKNARV